MVVTRYTVVALTVAAVLSLLVPVGGVVAADEDRDDHESTDALHLDLQADADDTVSLVGTIGSQTTNATAETADDVATNATGQTAETADDVTGAPSQVTETVTSGIDETASNATDAADRDRSESDPIATVERLSWEIHGVTVGYPADGSDAVTVVVESDRLDHDFQATPAVIDELARLLEAADAAPNVGITLADAGPADDEIRGGAEDGDEASAAPADPTDDDRPETAPADPTDDDREAAALALPDVEQPYRYVPPLTAGLFVLLKPLSGLLSGVLALVAEWAGRFSAVLRYSSRDGSDPLEHETRARIDDQVTDTPGISLTDLAGRLETPLSTVRYHVKTLERERYLTSRKQQGNRRLYPIGTEHEDLAAAMDNESTATIIESLARQGQATVGDIVDDVGTTYSTVSHHLSRLADAGVVQKEKDGRCTVSKLDPAARTALQRESEPPRPTLATRPSSAD